MAHCIICTKVLIGKQTKYCSNTCKTKSTNNTHQTYEAQKARGKRRKQFLIEELGGACQLCGYSKNIGALVFHHVSGKDFALDMRSLSNRSWDKIEPEVLRCQLLCSNCHMEVHYPDLSR